MTELLAFEREDLANAMHAIAAAGPALEAERAIARQVVDALSELAPDIDDVAVGRMLLNAASIINELASQGFSPAEISNALILAAIDLLALEFTDQGMPRSP